MSVLLASEAPVSIPDCVIPGKAVRPGFFQNLCRNGLNRRLGTLRTGALRLRDRVSALHFGQAAETDNAREIQVHDFRAYPALALKGTLGAADAYIDGWWSCEDLVGLFRLLTKNAAAMSAMDSGLPRFFSRLGAWAQMLRRNTIAGSHRNIRDHYDLGDDFYSLFLDNTMAYSSGVFAQPESTLAEASVEKFERICRKLELSPRDHLLEIGTGWGGFALHAARNYGCRVTTTTISRNQYEYARRRVKEAGLEDRVIVLREDYRQLAGAYDKIVSIEMIEAVGHEFLDLFFRKCSCLLQPDGLMVLQTITIPDHRYDAYRRSVDFIQKFIFPGGCIPAFSAMANSIRRATDFRVFHLEEFGRHYAETLSRWRAAFWSSIEQVRKLGFDDRFIRMWHYYLCYCEAGFLDNQIGVAHLVLAKPDCRRDPIL